MNNKISLSPPQAIQAWNIINDLLIISNNPAFTAWSRRLLMYMEPEAQLWNELSREEQLSLEDQVLEFPVPKINAQHLPDMIYEAYIPILEQMVIGEITPYQPQLRRLIEQNNHIG